MVEPLRPDRYINGKGLVASYANMKSLFMAFEPTHLGLALAFSTALMASLCLLAYAGSRLQQLRLLPAWAVGSAVRAAFEYGTLATLATTTNPEFIMFETTEGGWRVKAGYCYLALFPKDVWGLVAAHLGAYPTWKAVRRLGRFKTDHAPIRLTGSGRAHCDPTAYAFKHTYAGTRVGGRRDRRLSVELSAGLTACSPLGDNRWTSDHEVTQPLGTWTVDGEGRMRHTGAFIQPMHGPTTPGYCYLVLFAPRYRACAEAWLGKYPRVRALEAVVRRVKHFMSDREDLKLTITPTDRILLCHVSTGCSPGKDYAQVMRQMPRHLGVVGADGVSTDAPTDPGTGLRCACGRDEPYGSWNDTLAAQSRGCDCGSWPDAIGNESTYSCDSCGEQTIVTHSGVSMDTDAQGCPHCGRVWAVGDHKYRGASCVVRSYCDISQKVEGTFGAPGETLAFHGPCTDYQEPTQDLETGLWGQPEGWMYRSELTEGGLRDPSFRNLHWVHDDVWESSLTLRDEGVDARRAELWTRAEGNFRSAIKHITPGAYVAITAAGETPEFVSAHPSELAPGATHGVIFASRLGRAAVHENWTVVLVPLKRGEGRLLAGLRLIPTIAGRTDLDFVVVNAVMRHAPDQIAAVREALNSGLAHVSVTDSFLPVNLGAFGCTGCYLRPDRKLVRNSFARHGHVYGWDECVLAARNPVVWFRNTRFDPASQLRGGRFFPSVTVLSHWVIKPGFTGHRFAELNLQRAYEASQGIWDHADTSAAPRSVVTQEWASLAWAENAVRQACRRDRIPLLGDGSKKLSRVGGRMLAYIHNVGTERGCNAFGAIWRAKDFAFGLRNRMETSVTQSLSPELWEDLYPELKHPENQELYMHLGVAVELIKGWASGSAPIGVASVWSHAMADEFTSARGKIFKKWVFLSEVPGETTEDVCWVQLPMLYGSGNVFQLARLLPALTGRKDIIFSVVNDLETDWVPRTQRLAIALDALQFSKIVFPAMELNAPCPFQDATYTGDALVHLRESLLRGIARWGWVYGYDEVWSCSQQLPTVVVTEACGGASTVDFNNPKPARLLRRLAGGMWHAYDVAGGRFRAVLYPEVGNSTSEPLAMSLWARAKRAVRGLKHISPGVTLRLPSLGSRLRCALWGAKAITGLMIDFEPEELQDFRTILASARGPTVTFVTWGTYGDRIPVLAGARAAHAATRANVFVLHLCTLARGKDMLALCEADRALEFTAALFDASATVNRIEGNVIAPDYLAWGEDILAYSLRPGDVDAAPPGGGLPSWIDWAVQLIYWKGRARIRVGVYEGPTWFPRSANGHTFFSSAPRRTPGLGKKGVCIGSSSLPVPPEYADWERVPDGDHWLIAQDYDEIVCDGGAGKVQTFAAAGVPIIRSTNNKIDRKYWNPDNCGAGVTKNEPAEKWALAVAHFYPTYAKAYCGWKPSRWCTYFWWILNPQKQATRAWTALFMAYAFRQTHILPSIEATAASAFNLAPTNAVARVVMLWLTGTAVRAWMTWSGKTLLESVWALTGVLFTGVFSPATTMFVSAGMNAKKALILGTILSRFSAKTLAKVRLATPFAGTETGVWLIATPVWVSWVPVGVHVAYYEPSTQTVWDGVHQGGRPNSLGAPFRYRRRNLRKVAPLFAIKSELVRDDLELETRDVARPYSALWNCATMLLGVYLRHGRMIISLEIALLLFASSWAFAGIILAAAGLALASSSTLIAAVALTPLDKAFPEWAVNKKIRRVTDAIAVNLYWFADEDDEDPAENKVEEELIRDMAAVCAADAIKSGLDESTVFEALAEAVVSAAYDIEDAPEPSSVMARSLFEERRGPVGNADDSFAAFVNNLARSLRRSTGVPSWIVEGFAAYLGALLEWSESVTIEVVATLATALDFLEACGVPTKANLLADWLGERMSRTADSAARRKNVWAVLSKKRIEKLRRADWLALALQPLQSQETDNPAGWIARFVSRHHPEGEALEEEYVYRFPSWLPRNPRVSEMEYSYPSLLHEAAEVVIDPELTERVTRYVELGGSVGIDGMWVATDEARERVTSRYFSEPNPLSQEDLRAANDIAEVLYQSHPEAFENPGVVRPETVRQRLNMRGRSGVPFIQKVRTRRALESTGWMRAIISATYECIETGVYPPDAYAEFAKMMVLPANKLTTRGPRTIMATSLLNNFVNGVYELERRTRKVWPTTDMGMGAPLTARYMGEIFERVSQRKSVFAADMTEFDANIPPVIFEVLARLGELGAKDLPVVGASLRTKYLNLQNSHIYDLPSGKVWKKMRGGATGQSATSWDNSWAMRAVMIATWAHVTGRPMTEFYTTNTVHNTGDDNVWGTDDDINPAALSAAAQEMFGLDLRIEAEGLEAIDYLSKRPITGASVAGEILRVLDHVPTWTAMHSTARLLSRRGAVVSHASGRPYREFKRHLAERSVGHALLCAHNRPLYNLLGNEWMEDVRRFVGARNYAVVFDVERQEGDIEAIKPRFVANYNPTPEQTRRMNEITRGALKFPTYQRVLEAAYAEKLVPELSPYSYARVKPSLESVVRAHLVNARLAFHNWIPDALVKLSPTLTAAPYSPIFIVAGYPVEKFVWRSLPADVSLAEFASELRQAPWSVATDPIGFWWYLDTAGGRERVTRESELVIRGRMVVATVLYALLTECVHLLRASRLGLLVEAWQIYTQDAPRAFALLDSLHWLETSRSSPVISSMTPKDPYATQKQVAVCLSTACPSWICASVGWLPKVSAFASVAEALAWFRLARIGKGLDLALKAPHHNRWREVTPGLVEAVRKHGVISVSAPTSTGKSTEFVEQLSHHFRRVWVLTHTRYLRDTYSNPWMNPQNVVKLSAGIVDHGQAIAVCTYGHVCARHSAGIGPTSEDVVLLDELHDRKPIQGVALTVLEGIPRIAVTATPDDFYLPPDTPFFSVPIGREFKEAVPMRFDLEPMQLWAEAKRSGADVSRCLFILPSIAAVDAVTLALLSAGEQATAVTAKRRVMPKSGHIVGTSVVEAGVNITPPATCLIDAGLMVANNRGHVRTVPTTPDVAAQRLGRVGRLGDGTAFVATRSGTGEKGIEYPSYLDLIAAAHVRTWLLSKLGVKDPNDVMEPSSRVDARMRILEAETISRDRRNALEAWWLLSAATGSIERANASYDIVALTGWPEELDSVSNLLGRIKWLPPRQTIQKDLESRPFEMIFDGVAVRPLLVRLLDGQITWY